MGGTSLSPPQVDSEEKDWFTPVNRRQTAVNSGQTKTIFPLENRMHHKKDRRPIHVLSSCVPSK
jgi:hypothetical protein